MFEDDEQGNALREFEKMPLYKKASLIFDLADKIASLVKDNEEYSFLEETELDLLRYHADRLRNDAMLICPKIAGAEKGDLYAIRMENATIIRKAGHELQTGCSGLEMWGFKHTEYLELLRKEIEEFRVLFAEWVQTFDPWNYSLDHWGLFNPPGINHDDSETD